MRKAASPLVGLVRCAENRTACATDDDRHRRATHGPGLRRDVLATAESALHLVSLVVGQRKGSPAGSLDRYAAFGNSVTTLFGSEGGGWIEAPRSLSHSGFRHTKQTTPVTRSVRSYGPLTPGGPSCKQ